MKNKKLAILGHPTRYKEVIEILEMLSGEKIIFQGNNSECCYYLQNSIHIINVEDVDWFEPNNFVIFTLEDFLQKYPYKVGDKVLLNNQVKVIKGVGWDSTNNEVIYTLETNINGVNTQYQVFNYDLLPYKEEEDDDTKIYTDNAVDNDSQTDKTEKERAIDCIRLAIELAGDGGIMPFTEKEYELMYRFLDEISTEFI